MWKFIEKIFNKNNINLKINIDNSNYLYYNDKYRSNIEIFTLKEYKIFRNLYIKDVDKNVDRVSDNESKYHLENIKNPHDKVFRKALDKKENVIQIINTFLEKENKITEKDIEKYTSSYVLDKLKSSEADVVYKVKDTNVFFLIEHQTKIDYSMPYRILKYELAIIDSVIIDTKEKYKSKEYKYPVVIPIILYTGKNKWNAKLDLKTIQLKWKTYNTLELSNYKIYDINNISNEKLLREKPIINKILLMEKSKTEKEFIQNLNKISKELKNPKRKYTNEEKEFFILSVKAILKNQFDTQQIKLILEEIEKKEENQMMQVIEMLNRERAKLREDSINEGITMGIAKGKIDAKIEYIKNMLKEKLPIDLICKITGMTENEIRNIK